MARIESHSDQASRRVAGVLVPSGAETVLYVLLSVILLVIYNSTTIVNRLDNGYLNSSQNLKASFSSLSTGFSNSFSTALGGRLGQIVLWSFIGAITYIGLWLAKNVLNSFENDVVIDRYLHPSAYNRLGYWSSSFSVKIFLTATFLVTAAYAFLLLTVIFPALAGLAGSASYNFVLSSSPWYLVMAIAAVTLALYIGALLLRLLIHLWKLL